VTVIGVVESSICAASEGGGRSGQRGKRATCTTLTPLTPTACRRRQTSSSWLKSITARIAAAQQKRVVPVAQAVEERSMRVIDAIHG